MAKLCIYCGAAAEDLDHVPPNGLIRVCNRNNRWKVDSCKNCNGLASRDEEYFRMMIIGALCHTAEADEIFDGPISRSMNYRPAKEDWLFGSLGHLDNQVYIEWDAEAIMRVALKIVTGLAYKLGVDRPSTEVIVSIEETDGRGENIQWAPDFSFSHFGNRWELWFFDSVRIAICSQPEALSDENAK